MKKGALIVSQAFLTVKAFSWSSFLDKNPFSFQNLHLIVVLMEKIKTTVVFLILCCSFTCVENVKITNAASNDKIQFSSGVTVFSPLNYTYNSRFVTLNMTFDIGAGLDCSLNYSIDGKDLGAIPLVWVDTGYISRGQKSGQVKLPELSDGTHYLTIDVLCGLYDYHGVEPPGAPFTPTFPGSSDYIATWTNTIYFTINTTIPEFPSWTILPLLIAATLVGVIVRNKIRKNGLK